MNCQEARFQITALLDESLEEQEAQQLDLHLDSCPACASFQREQVELGQELARLEPFPFDPPATIWLNIQSCLEPPGRGWKPAWQRFLAAWSQPQLKLAGAALMVLVLFSLAVLRLPSPHWDDGQVLANLAAFDLTVAGNPFLETIDGQDELLRLDSGWSVNPFAPGGESR